MNPRLFFFLTLLNEDVVSHQVRAWKKGRTLEFSRPSLFAIYLRRLAENGFAPPPPREFCRHILSCRELKAESFKRCLHSVLRGVSL